MVNLNGRVAIVTGGSRGIGAAIAKELAAHGVKVVINYSSNREAADTTVKEIEQVGGKAFAAQADVSDTVQARVLVEETITKYGKLDILINNAGITRDRTFRKITDEDWNKVIQVNLNSVYNMTTAALSHILESDAGRIINISSIIGQAGGFGQTNYSAAKAGMIGFTKSLALELAKTGTTVNAICPGFIDTEMVQAIPDEIRAQIVAKIPVRRFGLPEEIARGVIYLCQDGEYITGQQLNINGGLYM
ncbi:acetoacetyl-CoA reductase [Aneurinibacillus thermoaerophilus]|uniref:3-oxoacyl-[acyl-carrier-protein] reductase n=2 Tax=Aneurinibacillus TaxID=55079 RepID=A0A1G7YMY1_ANETH|nr:MULTISPECIES: acetoacetyl-CoA reductase [Aneurinibacillus]AMA73793.1 beta-ketoacyl-ACP reductase [Aneurinibacillus sp. XH2]MED0756460.1 acetoacetyl-CoA reductase [Aneurinibacillus thermoaerophilus]MED0761141.1 acetoacetyl-CoA reductase [Aneurinibacillus thermoaerophilus]QYY43637.1 acetoacetyl-CoA reductase [Aneurinibacillus thermoaerophilus]SDG97888.1 3-oxoacyl-[acyl-carrier-protein] reductase [Aneurinibacillus thermoaerophilus]